MNAGVTSERVYDALKRQLLGGSVTPGERLEPKKLAVLLASSVTPVRDALHRLTGEQIVEMRTAEGFHLPLVTEPGLRELIWWNGELLRFALKRWPERPNAASLAIDAASYADSVRMLFSAIASTSGHPVLRREIGAMSDRLNAARIAEGHVTADADEEVTAITGALETGDVRALTVRVAAFHRRRLALVPAIVEAIYRRD